MPSNKDKVTSYLEGDKFQAIKQFCTENDFSYSEGVSYLIEKHQLQPTETPEQIVADSKYDEALELLEIEISALTKTASCAIEKGEKLEEQIAYLESRVGTLERQYKQKPTEYFTDDQVAAYVGAREETVREWRLGLRKPRGTNICSLLEEFELDFGRWRRRG